MRLLPNCCRDLGPNDRFNLLLYNTRVESFKPAPVKADLANCDCGDGLAASEPSSRWNRSAKGAGGRLGQFSGIRTASARRGAGLVDRWRGHARADPDRQARRLVHGTVEAIPADRRPKTDVFAVGDDANLPLLRMLSRNGGVMEQVLSTEPVDFKLAAFLGKVGRSPIGDLRLTVAPAAAVNKVYPLEDAVFDGGEARWVGQYSKPQKKVSFRVDGQQDGRAIEAESKADVAGAGTRARSIAAFVGRGAGAGSS